MLVYNKPPQYCVIIQKSQTRFDSTQVDFKQY